VNKGDLLVTIDPRPFQAEITQIEAEIAQAQSRQSLAESRTRRAKTLLDARAGSQEEYEETLQSQESATAEIAALRARLDGARLNLEFTKIRSPIAGRVGDDLVSAGNLVSAAETLLTTVVSMDPIYFAFSGSEQDFLNYSRLSQTGQRKSSRDAPNPVRIRLEDQDSYSVEGTMIFLDNTINQDTATINARAEVQNADGFLTPGMFGRLRLYGRDPFQAVVIPKKIIQYDQSRSFIWTLNDDDKVERTFIELGRDIEDQMIIVDAGVTLQDRIVASNVMAMRPGTAVSPINGTSDN
jgi:RND family efflux transporter MFP subunit